MSDYRIRELVRIYQESPTQQLFNLCLNSMQRAGKLEDAVRFFADNVDYELRDSDPRRWPQKERAELFNTHFQPRLFKALSLYLFSNNKLEDPLAYLLADVIDDNLKIENMSVDVLSEGRATLEITLSNSEKPYQNIWLFPSIRVIGRIGIVDLFGTIEGKNFSGLETIKYTASYTEVVQLQFSYEKEPWNIVPSKLHHFREEFYDLIDQL